MRRAIFLAITLLVLGAIRHNSHISRRRCFVIFLSILPTVFTAFIIMGLMGLGYQVNASVFLSLSIVLFLAALIYTESRSSLFNLLRKIPYTWEHRQYKETYQVLSEILLDTYLESHIELKERLKVLEEHIVKISIDRTGGNQSQAAKRLGLSRSTINRRVNK